MKIKKISLFIVLISIYCANVSFSVEQDVKEDEREIELVDKDKDKKTKIRMKREKAVSQSGMIKDMLEGDENLGDDKIPTIPLPVVRAKDLQSIVDLMIKADEIEKKNGKDRYIKNKIDLARVINGRKKTWKKLFVGWGCNKLMHLLQAADCINAPLLIRALAWEVSKKSITKKHLKVFPDNILYQIIFQYILRVNSLNPEVIMKVFGKEIIVDLKKENLYDQAIENLRNGKISLPVYGKDEDKIELGEPIKISKYIKGFCLPILAFGQDNGKVTLWDISSQSEFDNIFQILDGHSFLVKSLVFDKDGKTLVSGSKDGTIKVWSLEPSKIKGKNEGEIEWARPIKTLDVKNKVFSIAVSPVKEIIAFGSDDGRIELWNYLKSKRIKTFKRSLYEGKVKSIVFSPNGKTLASGYSKGVIKLWNVETGEVMRTIKGRTNEFVSVLFDPYRDIIFFGGPDGEVVKYNIETAKSSQVFAGRGNKVNSFAFGPNGKFLAYGCDDKKIILGDVKTGKKLKIFKGHTAAVLSVSLSSNGKTLASGSMDETVRVWDVKTGKCLKTLSVFEDFPWTVALKPTKLEEIKQS